MKWPTKKTLVVSILLVCIFIIYGLPHQLCRCNAGNTAEENAYKHMIEVF